MRFTIVICTHNRLALLRKVVASIDGARRPHGIELACLVIANACHDGTESWLQHRAARRRGVPLGWVRERQAGKTKALNRALSILQTDWAIFIDDDHEVRTDFLSAIANGIRGAPDASMFCGRIWPNWSGDEPRWARATGDYRIYPLPVPCFDLGDQEKRLGPGGRIPGGGNLAVHADALRRTGWFNEALGPVGDSTRGSEDTDYVLRALENGECLRYIPDMVQFHYVDPGRLRLSYIVRKSYDRSRSVSIAAGAGGRPVPLYLWRKAASYMARALVSLKPARSRFYMVRAAATFGEISACRDAAARANPTPEKRGAAGRSG